MCFFAKYSWDVQKTTYFAVFFFLVGPEFGLVQPQQIKVATKVVVGPLLLGDIYDRMPDQTEAFFASIRHLKDIISTKEGIPHEEVVKSLNRVKLYFLVETETKKNNGRQVKAFSEFPPVVTLQGPMVFQFQKKNGKKTVFQLKEVSFSYVITTVRERGDYQNSSLKVDIQLLDGATEKSSVLTFVSRGFNWNLEGRAWWTSEKTKKN